jgi:anti-anti-sigma factor
MNPAAYGSTRLTNEQGIWVLLLEGEHDLATLPQLHQQMQQVCREGGIVVIDLTRTTFIDCRIVGWLLRWSERARRSDDLRLAVAIGHDGSFVRRVIDVLRATETIPCHETKAEALASLRAAMTFAVGAAPDFVCV